MTRLQGAAADPDELDIVIVNWNSGDQLVACLRSLAATCRQYIASVVVVDNASSDGSLAGIDALGLPLTIIRNQENRGFAAACNQGARQGAASSLLFLNPDTRVFEDSLTIPLTFMSAAENRRVGICGIQLVDDSGEVARSCSRFPSFSTFLAKAVGLSLFPGLRGMKHHMEEWDHRATRVVDQVIGAFFLVRRSVFESLSGFDERFFVYFEEVDFSLRARRAGWQSVYLATARAFHAGGGTSKQVKAARLFYSWRSRLLYAFKQLSRFDAWGIVAVTVLIEPLGRIALALGKRSAADARHTLQAQALLLRALPGIITAAQRASSPARKGGANGGRVGP